MELCLRISFPLDLKLYNCHKIQQLLGRWMSTHSLLNRQKKPYAVRFIQQYNTAFHRGV